jgi:hypothetical protein
MFDAEVLPELEFRDMLFIPVVVGGIQITLTGHREAERELMGDPPPVPHFGLEHIGLVVDDLDAVLERFREQDLPVLERRPGAGGFEIAFVESPDEVCLELLQAPDPA